MTFYQKVNPSTHCTREDWPRLHARRAPPLQPLILSVDHFNRGVAPAVAVQELRVCGQEAVPPVKQRVECGLCDCVCVCVCVCACVCVF
jgi:hypothetical protein